MDRDLRSKACLMKQKHYAKHFRKKISQIKRRTKNDSAIIQAFFFLFFFFQFRSLFGQELFWNLKPRIVVDAITNAITTHEQRQWKGIKSKRMSEMSW